MWRNALSAEVVKRAEHWGWGSLWLRHQAAKGDQSRAVMQIAVTWAAGPLAGAWAVDRNRQRSANEEGIEPLGDQRKAQPALWQ